MTAPVETIEVARDEAGLRLDRWFRVHFPEVGYTYLQKDRPRRKIAWDLAAQ
jgi:23S rRNA pseudouridine955/2504/2580 synthase